ncbi:MAG: hypothetical protein ABIQ60_06665 [Burkholderiaceae bacterium]
MSVRLIIVGVCFALLKTATVSAADIPGGAADDAGALSLADDATTAAPSTRDWRLFVEGSVFRSTLRGGAPAADGTRLSVDLRYDGTIAPGWRAVVSDRLDLVRNDVEPRRSSVNTLREAYLSWHMNPDEIADVGRINLRYGAALGYNPTDFFKSGALRSIVSPDPASLRENRQGTVVIQGQKVWSKTSLKLAFSPKLGDAPSNEDFSLDFGATNPRNRWLLVGSHRFSEQLNPQFMLYGGAQTPTQVGLNLSGLVNRSTVAYLELSAGKGRSLIAQAAGTDEANGMQQRASLGLTYTTDFNLSLTGEVEYNSAGADRQQWNDFVAADPVNAIRLLGASQLQQDLPVRRALFVYASWRDMMMKNLDGSAFVRFDPETRSRAQWLEARYHWNAAEVALQWQWYSGAPTSLYGSVPQSRRLELVLRLFL